jgi:hypothetical protein
LRLRMILNYNIDDVIVNWSEWQLDIHRVDVRGSL